MLSDAHNFNYIESSIPEGITLGEYTIDPSAVGLISDSLARRFQAVPVGWEDNRLVVAMADPSNVVAIDDIVEVTPLRIPEPFVERLLSAMGGLLQTLGFLRLLEEENFALACKQVSVDTAGDRGRSDAFFDTGEVNLDWLGRFLFLFVFLFV